MTSLSVLSCKLLFKLAITSHCELYSFFPLVCYTIFDFEDHDLSNWTLTGTAFSNQPTYGDNPSERLKNDPTRKEPSKHTKGIGGLAPTKIGLVLLTRPEKNKTMNLKAQ